jgi:hypothetical protein
MSNLKVVNLAIYYGYPSLVNGANGDVTKAVEVFKPFDVIVFGDQIEHSTHGDHTKTKDIIAKLKPNGNKVFGYIPFGTTGSADSLTMAQVKQYTDEWYAMGVYGIFLDEYGFDYGVTRAKQNEAVSYIHSKGLKVFANSWVPDDAMGVKNERGLNEPPLLGAGDFYLLESWIAEGGTIQATSQWVSKADKCLAYQQSKGVTMAVLPTTPNPINNNVNYFPFQLASYACAMYGFSAFQWTDENYSASNNVINAYPLPQNYGTSFLENTVTHTSDYKTLTRKTDTGTFIIKPADGSVTFVASNTPPPPPPPPNDGDLQKQIDALKIVNANLTAALNSVQNENVTLTNKISSARTIVSDFITKINNALK